MIPRTSLEQWAVLAAVVDAGSFAAAAVALHRSQSAVSYAVSRLQAGLGIPVLTLEGRRSVLTPHGEILLKRARASIRDLESLELLARSLARGWEPELKLMVDAAFPRQVLFEVVAELQRTCPSTQIQLSEAVLSGAEDAIVAGAADVVVTSRVPPGFFGDPVWSVDFVAVARPDHPLFGHGRPLTADDLVRHGQSVLRDSGSRHRDEGWLGAEQRFTVGSMDTALGLVLAGLAFAWLPSHLLEAALANGRLRRLPLVSGGTRGVPLYLVLVRPELIGPAAKAAVAAFQRRGPHPVGSPLREVTKLPD